MINEEAIIISVKNIIVILIALLYLVSFVLLDNNIIIKFITEININ